MSVMAAWLGSRLVKRPLGVRAVPVDPQVQAVLDRGAAAGAPPLHEQSVEQARQAHTDATPTLVGPAEEVAEVLERSVAGPAGDVPVRVYVPAGAGAPALTVFMHGGGWVLGTLDSYDALCRALANASGTVVVSVGYRLAPEHPFPAAVEDSWAALLWACKHGAELGADVGRVAVAGDSAGGNIAAVLARRARDEGGPPLRFQLLVYPVIDAAMDTESYEEAAYDYYLEREGMAWFWRHYLAGADPASADASPLRASDLRGLPPAHVITAQYDPLRDEGEAYARALAEAGVPTTLRTHEGMTHGFFRWRADIDEAHSAMDEVARALRAALAE